MRVGSRHVLGSLFLFLSLWGLASFLSSCSLQSSVEALSQEVTANQEPTSTQDQSFYVEVTSEATDESILSTDAGVLESSHFDKGSEPGPVPDATRVEKTPSDLDSRFQGVPVVDGCPIFPKDSAWNTDISQAPVDPNSSNIIARIGANESARADFGTVWKGAPIGIPFVVVDANQKKVPVKFRYADESDPGPYPIPSNPPIEGGPNGKGDRHVLVLQRSVCKLYELFNAFPRQGYWEAGSGAIFDLRSSKLRPDTWTSADAAGLPIFPGLVRYEEVASGEIRHALRFTVQKTQRAFVHPATHWASSSTDKLLPPMGMRVRLKASFSIAGFPPRVQVILRALKKYGMFVSDNGGNWFISGAPNMKWDDDELRNIMKVKGKDFEVIRMDKIYRPSDFGRP